jgi:hypothetical protein
MGLAAATAITSVAAIGGGIIASKGAKSASRAQVQASQDANAAQERMFQEQNRLQEPFRQGGLTAQNRIMQLLGLGQQPSAAGTPVNIRENPEAYGLRAVKIPGMFGAEESTVYTDAAGKIVSNIDEYAAQNPIATPAPGGDAGPSDFGKYARDFGTADFESDPGYAFRQSEGMKALERSAAARGNLLSGSTLKGVQRFGQDLASQEYQNAFNRYQVNRSNQLNPLQSLMGAGQSATNVMTGAAGQAGQNQASNLYNAGAARASGYVGSANAFSNALGQIGGAAANYPMNNAIMNYYNRLPAPGGTGTGPGGTFEPGGPTASGMGAASLNSLQNTFKGGGL